MACATRRRLLIGVVVLVVLGMAVPTEAAYLKAFRFRKPTDIPTDVDATYPRLRVYTNGLEVVTDQYLAWRNPWGEGTLSTVLLSGVYSTRIVYRDPVLDPDFSWDANDVKVGWSTSDSSCRLRDLTWVYKDNAGTVLTQSVLTADDVGSEPGGGYVEKVGDCYAWTIVNDIGPWLQLHALEFGAVGTPLLLGPEDPADDDDTGTLLGATEQGLVGTKILALRQSVVEVGAAGKLPPKSVRSLTRKLDSAMEDYEAGMAAYEQDNDIALAKVLWAAAAQHMQTFISELQRKQSPVPDPEGVLWTAEANEIIHMLENLPMPNDDVPEDPILYYGESYTFTICGEDAASAGAFILRGVVLSAAGEPLFDWVEQFEIPSEMDPPTAESEVVPLPNGAGWNNTDVSVTLSASDTGGSGVAGIYALVDDLLVVDHEEHPPDPTVLGLLGSPSDVNLEGDGMWRLGYMAVDGAGNTSASYNEETGMMETGTVMVKIDTLPPEMAASVEPDDQNLWPPDNRLEEIGLVVNVDGTNPEGWPATWHILSVADTQPGLDNDPENPDWIIGNDGVSLWVRAELSSADPTRYYTVTLEAEDVAGNTVQAIVVVGIWPPWW